MSGTVKRLQNKNKKSSNPFSSFEYDSKVSKSIAKNHYNEEILDRKYETWCEKNQIHLVKMYSLSGLDVDFNIFCNYIYKNSEK